MKLTNLLFSLSLALNAQLAAPNPAGVAMGHIHVHSKDPAAQKSFWVDLLGAKEIKLGDFVVYKLVDAIVFVQKTDPTGGSEGSVVNHVGFKVPNLTAALMKIQAAHTPIVTQTATQAMLLAPDDIRVELTEDPAITQPLVNHHIHFYTANVDEMKKWYVTTFGAIPGKRGKFEAADLPGVNLSFTPSTDTLAPTKGRALDHIGFEVKDLEAFVKKLEATGIKFDVPYRKLPQLKIAIAFFKDPWGTNIELTEGLDKL
jgi:catechol 2,3-dioxygenase-like lactoylglutathione lyase family enzyme